MGAEEHCQEMRSGLDQTEEVATNDAQGVKNVMQKQLLFIEEKCQRVKNKNAKFPKDFIANKIRLYPVVKPESEM